jgi:photosystem II stability/assembly factor-like uncharacterized protein
MILRTQDGGLNWWRIPSGSGARLEDVTFVGVTVFAVGTGGTILRSADGGVNWQFVLSGVPTRLKSVHFGDALHGIIVGDSGVALTTQDGGTTWMRSYTGVNGTLIDVRMSGPAAAIAVGTNGLVIRSDDGGRTWRSQAASTGQYLTGVAMSSPASAAIVGLGGVGFFTTDGGSAWIPANLGTTVGMSDVCQADPVTLYAAGSSATIVRSRDGGRMWQTVYQSNGFAFEDIGFANPQTGWAVGNNGVILRTTDGGNSWVHQMAVPGTSTSASVASPALVPTSSAPMYLSVMGLAVAAPSGGTTWRASVGTASNGNRMDEVTGTGPSGQLVMATVVHAEGRECANVLAGLIQAGGQMRTAPRYTPAGWFQVSVEKDGTSAFTCLPLRQGSLVAGFAVTAVALLDPDQVRPLLNALADAAFQRWGRP